MRALGGGQDRDVLTRIGGRARRLMCGLSGALVATRWERLMRGKWFGVCIYASCCGGGISAREPVDMMRELCLGRKLA